MKNPKQEQLKMSHSIVIVKPEFLTRIGMILFGFLNSSSLVKYFSFISVSGTVLHQNGETKCYQKITNLKSKSLHHFPKKFLLVT
jgi:hypothetical protein